MFDTLSERLTSTVRQLAGRGRITEKNVRDSVREIRMALLEADVALPVAKTFVERVRQRALGEEVARSLNPGQAFTKIVHDEIVRTLGSDRSELNLKGRPSVIMLVGLQGAGKTTTAGKLAGLLQRRQRADVLLVSTDVYRPAARDQLEKLATDLGVRYFASDSDDPTKIAEDALSFAELHACGCMILDTAGRLHVDEEMMSEARELHKVVKPNETLFVIDSMGGQDALQSARAFHEALELTGVILTKTDGDARGGAALSVRESTGMPIKFVGTGEKLDALEAFDPSRMASRILGMGDVVGFVEQVQEKLDRDEVERVARKVKKGRALSLEDFKAQLEQMLNMGGVQSLLEKMPGMSPQALPAAQLDDKNIRRQIAVIDSMTPSERKLPAQIDSSRKRRIAAGCGQSVQDVNRLLKQHKQLVKTMKRFSKGGGMEKMLGAALRGRPGPRPR